MIKTTQFTYTTVTEGLLKGRERVIFQHNNTDKTHKLSLSNPTLRGFDGDTNSLCHDIVADPHDSICTVRLLKHHVEHNLPPNWKGCLFIREASDEVIRSRKNRGISHLANASPCPKNKKPKGTVGKSFLTTTMRALARYCKFENAELYTGRSCRKSGISKMAKHGVATGEMCEASRHKSVQVNNGYQSRSVETAAQRQVVFHVKPPPSDTCPIPFEFTGTYEPSQPPVIVYHNNHFGDHGNYNHFNKIIAPPPNAPFVRPIVNPYLKKIVKYGSKNNHPGHPSNFSRNGQLKDDNHYDYGGSANV